VRAAARRGGGAALTSATRARVLEITSYPPPRAGWGIRVEYLKKHLEREGHECVVLNTGTSRRIPSPDYETVMSGMDLARKTWRFARRGFLVHAHTNGDSWKGLLLAIGTEIIALAGGRRPVLTFHAGAIQRYFPIGRAPWLVPLFWFAFLIPRRIICNNQAVKDRIVKYAVPAAKISVIGAFTREYLEYVETPPPSELNDFLQRYPQVLFSYVRMRPLFYPLVLIDAMAQIAATRDDTGLVICGGMSHGEPALLAEVQARIARHGLSDRICFVDDLDHDAFLTVLSKSAIYVRTPITDGVASSVLESLALGVPVVACENGTRPAGVLTYPVEDAGALARLVTETLANRAAVCAGLARLPLPDTLPAEAQILTS
jgi:glycosyltransferase involved in cell wall biosynthesis